MGKLDGEGDGAGREREIEGKGDRGRESGRRGDEVNF